MMARAISAALAALILTTGAFAQTPAKMRVLFPIVAVDEVFAPVIVAKQMGYFKDEGLDVSLVPTNGANVALIQLAAGNGEVGLITPSLAVVGTQPSIGMRLTLFYNLYYQGIWSITVPEDSPLKTLAEIKGKKIGVIAMGSAGLTYGKAYLSKAGLDPNKDAIFIPIGVGGQGATALKSKAVDAVVYFDGMVIKMRGAGVPLRELPVDERINRVPDVALTAPTELLEKNPAQYVGFSRAIAKGYEFNAANPEAAVRMVWKEFPASKPANLPEEQALKQAIEVNTTRIAKWVSPRTGGKHGLFLEDDYKELVQFCKDFAMIPEDAAVDLSKFYTNAVIEEANKFDREAVKKQAASFDISTVK
jgi:NitT/TauT family transport system substrate-binding protein